MSDVMLSFKGQQEYMTKDQLKEVCPLAFADAPTNPKVSEIGRASCRERV